MRPLLDTHTLLWWLEDPRLLSEEARNAVRNGKNVVYVSAAVVWEIVIKKSLAKLDAPDNIEKVLATNRFLPLSITIAHVLTLQALPLFHKDPFDRIIVAQSICEGLTVVSRDPNIGQYPVAFLLA